MVSFLAEYRRGRNLEPFKPRVMYGASGGCLAAYLMMMSSFTERVEEWTFSSDMFIDRPTPVTPRLLTLALKGFLYHRTDLTEYIKGAFVPCKLQDVEIVTGYYETNELTTSRLMVKIVSNFPSSRSVLVSQRMICTPTVQSVHPPERPEGDSRVGQKAYLDELMLLVIDALHKTTNIPFMMEPLGESACVDYGVVSPSPRVIANADVNRSIYFSPIDIERLAKSTGADMIFHQYILNDVFSVQTQFKGSTRFAKPDVEQSFTAAFSLMRDLDKQQTRFCLVIYSTSIVDLPIYSFTNKMVKSSIAACKANLRFLVLHD